MSAGQTLYIRGGTSPDTNTACTGDGAQNGACWTGTFPSSYRGADGNPVTIAAYPGETVIIEPTGSGDIMNLGSPRSSCSNIVFRDLIFDARNRGKARVIKVQPLIWPGGTEDANLCHHISFIGGKIRHGGQTSAIEPYASYFTIDGVEIYENGWHDSLDTCSDGEHDHAIYGGGGNWLIQNSYFHHNIQAIQVWWPALSSPGNWRILNNRFHDNDINPWAEAQFGTGQGTPCPGFGGVIALYDSTGSRCTIQGNQIYNHTRAAYGGARRPQNGVDLGGAWGSPVSGCTVTGNWIYGNSGVQVLVGSGSLGNTTSPNYDHAP